MTPVPEPKGQFEQAFPRRTIFDPIKDRPGHARYQYNPRLPNLDMHRYDEYAIRNIMTQLEEAGFTTHLTVIRRMVEVIDEQIPVYDMGRPTNEYIGSGERIYIFPPPRYPEPGEDARIEGGRGSGATFVVPEFHPHEVPAVDSIYGEVRVNPFGFDTATGHWLYNEYGEYRP